MSGKPAGRFTEASDTPAPRRVAEAGTPASGRFAEASGKPASRRLPMTLIKAVVFAAALVPAAALAYGFYTNDLTANPGDYITDQTGTWALAFLFISLSVTPIRRLSGWNEVIRLRRMLGLFSFFYALLHMLTWLVLLHFFDLSAMIEDVAMRPFITIGMATFVILLALAVTSNQLSIRLLKRRWQTLHRFAYVAAIFAVVHFWWLVKADTSEPQRWALALAILLGLRGWWAFQKRRRTVTRASR